MTDRGTDVPFTQAERRRERIINRLVPKVSGTQGHEWALAGRSRVVFRGYLTAAEIVFLFDNGARLTQGLQRFVEDRARVAVRKGLSRSSWYYFTAPDGDVLRALQRRALHALEMERRYLNQGSKS